MSIIKVQEDWLNVKTSKYVCPYCDKEYTKNGIGTHIWRMHGDGIGWTGNNDGYKKGTRKAWNKDLTKETDERVLKNAQSHSDNIKSGKTQLSGYCSKNYLGSKEHKENSAKGGGFREGAGRGKKGKYKGYYCDSSWELAFVIYNLDHNIYFERNTEGFEYIIEGKTKKYYPDFILDDETYLEIKGYNSDEWKIKLKSFKKPIKVLYEKEIKKYIDYVINTYGKDYINLYD